MSRVIPSALKMIDHAIKYKKLAIFCGAGISKNSGLPIVDDIMPFILKKLTLNYGEIKEIFDIKNNKLKLPFEALMEILSQNSDITPILSIFELGEPNNNHTFIAKLASNNFIKNIFTTNFDLLIEKALEKEGLRENVDFKVYCKESAFSNIGRISKGNSKLPDKSDLIRVIKIHGSIKDLNSIRTTMKAIASKTSSRKRMNVTKYLFSTGEHDTVLVMGYSCSDIFDINPHIQSLKDKKSVIYLKHENDGEPEEKENRNVDENIDYLFKDFPGKIIAMSTDNFIRNLWNTSNGFTDNYKEFKTFVKWKQSINKWIALIKKRKDLNYLINGRIFDYIPNYKRAIKYYKKALKIYKDNRDKPGKAGCYTRLGFAYYGLGGYYRAIDYYKKALKINKNTRNKPGKADCYIRLGIVYYGLNAYSKAIEYYKKGLIIYKDIKDKQGETNSYCDIGIAYHFLDNYDKAIEYNIKALKICIDIGDKRGESNCYGNLGNAYNRLGNQNRAIKYYKKGLQIFKDIGYRQGELNCYISLGNAYNDLGSNSQAIEYHNKALEICKDIGDKRGELECYNGLGTIHDCFGSNKQAIEYHKKALEISQNIKYRRGESECYNGLGNAYCHLGSNKQAIEYHKKALEICQNIKYRRGESECYNGLGNAHDRLGNQNRAIEYHKKALKICKNIGYRHEEFKFK